MFVKQLLSLLLALLVCGRVSLALKGPSSTDVPKCMTDCWEMALQASECSVADRMCHCKIAPTLIRETRNCVFSNQECPKEPILVQEYEFLSMCNHAKNLGRFGLDRVKAYFKTLEQFVFPSAEEGQD